MDWGILVIAYVAVLCVGGAFGVVTTRRERLVPTVHGQTLRRGAVEPATLDHWLSADDSPIDHPDADIFEHRILAERIARRLLLRDPGSSLPTFILSGPFGSGKTSIYYLVRYYIQRYSNDLSLLDEATRRPMVVGHTETKLVEIRTVCRVPQTLFVLLSAWQFHDTQSLLRGVLAAISASVHNHVDAYALSGLPASYVATVSSAGSWVSSLAAALGPKHDDADVVLDKIEHVLLAVSAQVVVWVDDLERFAASQEGTVEPMRALLGRCRHRRNITFVLAQAQE